MHRDRLDELLDGLLRMRCVQLSDIECADDRVKALQQPTQAPELAERVEALLPKLRPFTQKRRRPFRAPHATDRVHFAASEFFAEAPRVVEQAERLFAKKAELEAERNAALERMRAVTPFLDWSRPLDFAGTQYTVVELGSLPAATPHEVVLGALSNHAVVAQITCNDKTGVHLALVMHRDEREQTMQSLYEIGFLRAEFAERDGTARALFDRADRKRAQLEGALAQLERRLCSLAARMDDLEAYSDVLHTRALCHECYGRMLETGHCVLFGVLCPEDRGEQLCALLEHMGAAYEKAESTAEQHQAPVSCEQPAVLRSFAPMLGTDRPLARGLFDPTAIFAVLYCLLFGLFFADAGYGLLLLLLPLALMKLLYLPRCAVRALSVLCCCGGASLLFGVLGGRYFGNLPLQIAAALQEKSVAEMPSLSLIPLGVLRTDAVLHPIWVLLAPAVLATVHLECTMIARCVGLLRQKEWRRVLLDEVPFFLFTVGVTLLCVFPLVPWFIGLGVLLGGAIYVLFTQGRAERTFPAKMKGGARGFGGMLRHGVMLLQYWQGPISLGVAAALVCLPAHLVPAVAKMPFVGLLLACAAFAVAWLLCRAARTVLGMAYDRGVPHADVYGRFYSALLPVAEPLVPVERYTLDATPIQMKQQESTHDRT